MNKLASILTAASLLLIAAGPVFAQKQEPKGTEGPGMRKKSH